MRKTVGITAGVAAAVVLSLVALSCGSSTDVKQKTYVANLIAANEGAGHTSAGSGVVTFVDEGTDILWTMELTNMTNVTLSHIHLGDATAVGTAAGPVIINLFLPNRPPETGVLNGLVAQGTITSANNASYSLDALRVLFNNGGVYVNVHTVVNPAGEIRDQIHPVP
jgi:hypothetical protein